MSDINPNPTTQSKLAEEFMINFVQKKDDLNSQIVQLAPDVGSAINVRLTSLAEEIQLLSKQLHDAVMFLPSYSIKMRQNEIRDLERALKEKEDVLIPKKKFGFKSKLVAQPTPAPVIQPEPKPDGLSKSSANGVLVGKVDNYFTIENINGATIQHIESDLNGNDVLVRNCEDATISLEGGPSTLRLANLKNCKLLCGPVRTSIFIDNVLNSTLYLCCQQLRTHTSEKLDIYLRVGSRAIIEDCKEIRFGPYNWDHGESEKLHKRAEINSDLERYDAVDDFNWLSSSPSPNWSVIPPEERVSFVSSS